MNGYFQLLFNDSGTNIIIYPPTEGDKSVDLSELMNYLSARSIQYDMAHLNRSISHITEKTTVLLSDVQGKSEQEAFVLNISEDRMKAVARFYPPAVGSAAMTASDIIADLSNRKIVAGINQVVISAFLANRKYCTDYCLAQGSTPVNGTDARIEYYFSTDLSVRPTLLEDGSVDFFHLHTMNQCTKGQLIAKLFRENPGEFGETIFGEKIKPRDVKKLSLKYGRNITINEEKTELLSDVNGHVSLLEGKVFVSDIYEIANVDNATGDIEYEGCIQVNGNVCSNFSIKAKGNISINGVVEGAYIEAGGNITIARGMNGMNKGILKAGGNVIAKFIENATVFAGGFVETESILHSKVQAKTEVNVVSKKGFITGGYVSATQAVHAKNLGSPMGGDTVIEIGVDPAIREKYMQLQNSIRECKKTLELIRPVIVATAKKLQQGVKVTPEQGLYFKQLALTSKQKQEQLQADEVALEEMEGLVRGDERAQVTVTGEVYTGTKIVISDVSIIVKDTMKYCRFIRSHGEVAMTSL